MVCSYCGKEASGKFCASCGASLENIKIVIQPEKSKQLEEPGTDNKNVFYNNNGVLINLTAIGDQCGPLHMTKAINILMEQTGLTHKEANKLMYETYKKTPPSRATMKSFESKTDYHKSKMKSIQRDLNQAKEMRENIPASCPKCGSTSLSADKKGFGIGKAVIGAALTGGIGLIAGNIGAKKVRVTCLKCGHQFIAGKQ